ncbi:hypothetical protein E3N88_04131 [Mikania micrantha]|uniref:Uncharacterized protein n=1 Tax=Mikania micrantha TaxID=192012 RepID=A0A5N6LY83_9ASTR|nr:hypothetical protein E3N88_34477 [Mikania micrantha]KAD7116863.1 hypothetical protein E3N88_04131 [Mikania micrantha]
MASKTLLFLALSFAVVLLIASEVSADKDTASNHDSHVDDRGGYGNGGHGGYGGTVAVAVEDVTEDEAAGAAPHLKRQLLTNKLKTDDYSTKLNCPSSANPALDSPAAATSLRPTEMRFQEFEQVIEGRTEESDKLEEESRIEASSMSIPVLAFSTGPPANLELNRLKFETRIFQMLPTIPPASP